MTISDTAHLIKGESSFWINKQGLTNMKFSWQKDYFAVSVSDTGVPFVRKYIANQEIHHQKKSFQNEYDEYIKKHGFMKLRE